MIQWPILIFLEIASNFMTHSMLYFAAYQQLYCDTGQNLIAKGMPKPV